jgi:hypothetical protein
MRAMAKRGEHVWLVTSEHEDPPVRAQVLDLAIGSVYPPHPYAAMLKAGEWEELNPLEAPDVEPMLSGVEVMPNNVPNADGFSMTPATSSA